MKKIVRRAVSASFVLGSGQIASASSHENGSYELHGASDEATRDLLRVVLQGDGEA